MQTRTKYEEQILTEIRDLPELIQEKMVKVIHFFRSDIIGNNVMKENEEKITNEFLSVCGTWEDNQSAEYQIKAIYSSRSSTNRAEKMK